MAATKSKSQHTAANSKNGDAAGGSKLVDAEQAANRIASELFGMCELHGYSKPNSTGVYQPTDLQTVKFPIRKTAECQAEIYLIQADKNSWLSSISFRHPKFGGGGWPRVGHKVHPDSRAAMEDAVAELISRFEGAGDKKAEQAIADIRAHIAELKNATSATILSTSMPAGIRKFDRDAEPNAVAQAIDGGWFLDCDLIDQNPFQPRKRFDQAAIESFAANINQVGLLESVKVRPHPERPGRWQLIDGARRLAAHRFNGADKIKAERRDATDEEMLLLALATFDHKEPLSAMEHADALWLASRPKKEGGLGVSIPKLAGQLGCSESHVRNTIRLAVLPEPWRSRVISQEMSPRHARGMLAAIDNAAALSTLNQVWTERAGAGLTTNAADWEELVNQAIVENGGASRKRAKKEQPPAEPPRPAMADPHAADDDDGSYTMPAFKVGNMQVVERVYPHSTPAKPASKEPAANTAKAKHQDASSKPAVAAAKANGEETDAIILAQTEPLRKAIALRIRNDAGGDGGVLEGCAMHLLCGKVGEIATVLRGLLKDVRPSAAPLELFDSRYVETLDDYRTLLSELVVALLLGPNALDYFDRVDLGSLANLMAVKVEADTPAKPKPAAKKPAAKKSKPAKKSVRRPSSKTATRAAKKKGGRR